MRERLISEVFRCVLQRAGGVKHLTQLLPRVLTANENNTCSLLSIPVITLKTHTNYF